VQDAVFEYVKEHFEHFVGEMSEDHYNDAIYDIKCEQIDCEISTTYQGEVNELLCEYGIDNAIKLYYDVHGDLNKVTSYGLLQTILTETTKSSYDDYITWLNK